MFNSGIKGNQRCNGLKTSPAIDQILNDKLLCHTNYTSKNKIGNRDVYNNKNDEDRTYGKGPVYLSNSVYNSSKFATHVKLETDDLDIADKIGSHSIIGLSELGAKIDAQKDPTIVKPRYKRGNIRETHHEVLQRIDSETDVYNHYQQHWFSASLEKFKLEDRSREERIEITRHEFRRHIQQLVRSNVGQPNRFPDLSVQYSKCSSPAYRNKHKTGYNRLVAPRICDVEKCLRPALPCTKHCTLHIMLNTEQVLFEYCTAKFADNTQCAAPVFDIMHELPLCAEHARKRDNYKLYQEAKPKKLRKKVKPSAMIRPQKRNKKKKKLIKTNEISGPSAILEIPTRTSPESVGEIIEESPELEVEDMHMVDQVLGLNENGLEQALVTQAHLLEETDINTVLSTIQVDEFSDFFTVNRNGEYEPSREEAEELEKALAEVDNDVKSLEKLSQSQGLLDSLLDEHALAESLVQIPEMFHNGYTPCGDSMVTQTSSYLLPVEPHSHS
ncbi:INO80 complex subunit D isoform X2 [Anoplophora glabripennis]|uniref:INO80 complex subunit D isoform X2 n=1 Tax=Anoplophora glabripennis TaxID=217634 RepID=UPI0008742639|nr:INO80 complex subunit D isoform X2 [Anoplophora glabripennis]